MTSRRQNFQSCRERLKDLRQTAKSVMMEEPFDLKRLLLDVSLEKYYLYGGSLTTRLAALRVSRGSCWRNHFALLPQV